MNPYLVDALVVLILLSGYATMYVAKTKGKKNLWVWFILGALFSVAGLALARYQPKKGR